ncbi:tyrosine-type recombinase/integrase [Nonomuraea diastatica]|uniref:tyrosine-type recombinase/integrase n=1 Tax=Nonomuraea diastatica TaxID=1848329 RepID=UPI00140CCC86|nr:tyrosine-type recombinase/integrase [Nonomuraea diastatica]
MKTYDVQIWNIQIRKEKRKPYVVRWVVGGRTLTESYAEVGQADSRRSELMTAARKGEAFDTGTGLPESMHRVDQDITWFQHALDYVAAKWKKASSNQRRSIVESMIAVTPALTRNLRGAPDNKTLRNALRWAFIQSRPEEDQPEEVQAALRWLHRASLPLTTVTERKGTAKALDACATQLDGSEAVPEYYRRRRRVLYNSLRYAVLEVRLRVDPLDDNALRSEWKQPDVDDAVDPRAVSNPRQVAQALTMCSYVGRRQGERFVAFFGCMYYAMMRPAEVSRLRRLDCHLPEEGWGKLILEASTPEVGEDYTDNGELHDNRSLKGRSKKTVRVVPIPPELVALLRGHMARFGVAEDGRLFRSESGRPVPKSTYSRLWKKVRALTLTPEQLVTPLMGKPYDLRHAGVTWRLSTGVPAAQVAEWAGHSVEVLQRIYHRCMAGYDEVWIERMDRAREDSQWFPTRE